MSMLVRVALTVLAAAIAAVAQGADSPAGSARPNILLILADDYGLDGVGCYGSDRFKGKTPNLDRLAATGLRFERCYSTPLCGPTRCQLTTGRYPFRTGGLTNQVAGRPSSQQEPSVAKLLKQAGYATGHAGKWRQMGETPSDWGYDEYLTDPTAGGWYWQTNYTTNGKLVQLDKEAYIPDLVQKFAVDFMTRHRDRPFFFYYATHLVHGPILRTPDTKPDAGSALYDDNVAYLDKQVGQLVAELDRLKLREKTLILFSGDNGTARASGTIGGRQIHGQKGTMLEGGSRVPLIADWQGTTSAGKVCKDLVDFSDFFATLAELAGAKPPSGVTFDSHSFAPQLRGQPGTPREWIFVQLGRRWYVRDDGWKLTESGELFDMRDAPFVEKPVAADAQDAGGAEARKRLQGVLDKLDPASGKTDVGREKVRKPKAERKRKRAAEGDGEPGAKPRAKKAKPQT